VIFALSKAVGLVIQCIFHIPGGILRSCITSHELCWLLAFKPDLAVVDMTGGEWGWKGLIRGVGEMGDIWGQRESVELSSDESGDKGTGFTWFSSGLLGS